MCKTRRTTSRLEGWENIEQYTKTVEFNDIRNDMMNRNLSSYTISRAAHSGQTEEHNDNEHHSSRWGQHTLNTRMWLERCTRFLPPWLWEVYCHSYSNPTWVYELDRLELPARSNIPGGVTANNDVLSLARYWLIVVISQLVEADVLPFSGLTFAIVIWEQVLQLSRGASLSASTTVSTESSVLSPTFRVPERSFPSQHIVADFEMNRGYLSVSLTGFSARALPTVLPSLSIITTTTVKPLQGDTTDWWGHFQSR